MIAMITDKQAKRIIAKRVCERLESLGKSRYWLAQQTARRESTIAQVCNGTTCCKADLLATIADALGVTTDSLLRDEASPRKKTKFAKSA